MDGIVVKSFIQR